MKKLFSMVALCAVTLFGSMSMTSCGDDDEEIVDPTKNEVKDAKASVSFDPCTNADFQQFCDMNLTYTITDANGRTTSDKMVVTKTLTIENIACPCTINIEYSYSRTAALENVDAEKIYTVTHGPVYSVKGVNSFISAGSSAQLSLKGEKMVDYITKFENEKSGNISFEVSKEGKVSKK